MKKFALQLHSIKEDVKQSFKDALDMTKSAGYSEVEFAGYFGFSANEIKKMLDARGLSAVSTHIGGDRVKNNLQEEISFAKEIGYNLIVCPWAELNTKEQVEDFARMLENAAQEAKKEGIQIGYHNHAFEFEKINDEYKLDMLLRLAPTVKLEPDVYWIAYAGVDIIEYLKPYAKASRICAIHAKEISKDDSKKNVYIGDGKIDFKKVYELCPDVPFIVEQEEYTTGRYEGIVKCFEGANKQINN